MFRWRVGPDWVIKIFEILCVHISDTKYAIQLKLKFGFFLTNTKSYLNFKSCCTLIPPNTVGQVLMESFRIAGLLRACENAQHNTHALYMINKYVICQFAFKTRKCNVFTVQSNPHHPVVE